MAERNEVVIRARRLLATNRDRKVRDVVESLLRYIELLEGKIVELKFDKSNLERK